MKNVRFYFLSLVAVMLLIGCSKDSLDEDVTRNMSLEEKKMIGSYRYYFSGSSHYSAHEDIEIYREDGTFCTYDRYLSGSLTGRRYNERCGQIWYLNESQTKYINGNKCYMIQPSNALYFNPSKNILHNKYNTNLTYRRVSGVICQKCNR